MTLQKPVRTSHDAWAKDVLRLWLQRLGDVQIDASIDGEQRRGDVYFVERRRPRRQLRELGALGKLARGRVLFEHYWNAPTTADLNSCFAKRIELDAHERRTARREKRPGSSLQGTTLCVILPSLSPALAAATEARQMRSAPAGFFTLAPILRTVFVVTNQLPRIRSTLWLRLLGRGDGQANAIVDLEEFEGEQTSLRDDTLQLLLDWRDRLAVDPQVNNEAREMIMRFAEWEENARAKGRTEGEARGQAKSVVRVLEARGIPVSAAQRARVLSCTDESVLDAWLLAAMTVESASKLFSSARRSTPAAGQRRAPRVSSPRRAS